MAALLFRRVRRFLHLIRGVELPVERKGELFLFAAFAALSS